MTDSGASLVFFKLFVPEMAPALAFWCDAMGFEVRDTFEDERLLEKILALPGQDGAPSLLLVNWKDGRDVTVGNGHGPIGIQVRDIEAARDHAMAAGAQEGRGLVEHPGVKLCFFFSPQGHEIELVQIG